MAANVLNSVTANRMSVFVVRAFVKMRAMLSSNKGLADELEKLERKLTGRLDAHEIAIVDVLRLIILNFSIGNQCCPCRPSKKKQERQGRRLIKLLEPPLEIETPDPKPKGPIGFQP